MIASWRIGRARVARNERPGWLAAWGLVGLDFAAILIVFALIWQPLISAVYAAQPSNAVTILIMLIVFFVPLQVVMITSSLWASRSRWEDKPDKGEDA